MLLHLKASPNNINEPLHDQCIAGFWVEYRRYAADPEPSTTITGGRARREEAAQPRRERAIR